MCKSEKGDNVKMIYLYRHGETNWNVENKITGHIENEDIVFTKFGYQQIVEISKSLQQLQIEAIFSSDFNRAMATAILANKNINLPISFHKELRGLNMGKYQGLSRDEFIANEEVKACFSNHNLAIIGGESINDLNKRLINFIYKICCETKYKKIAIITHGAAIGNLRAYLSQDCYARIDRCTLMYKGNKLKVLSYEQNKNH